GRGRNPRRTRLPGKKRSPCGRTNRKSPRVNRCFPEIPQRGGPEAVRPFCGQLMVSLTLLTAELTTAMAGGGKCRRSAWNICDAFFELRQPAAAFGVAACCPPPGALRRRQFQRHQPGRTD